MSRITSVGDAVERVLELVRSLGYDTGFVCKPGGAGGGSRSFFMARSRKRPEHTLRLAIRDSIEGALELLNLVREDFFQVWKVPPPPPPRVPYVPEDFESGCIGVGPEDIAMMKAFPGWLPPMPPPNPDADPDHRPPVI